MACDIINKYVVSIWNQIETNYTDIAGKAEATMRRFDLK